MEYTQLTTGTKYSVLPSHFLICNCFFYITAILTISLTRHAVIIMEYVGSRNLHRLLVELREKTLGTENDFLLCISTCVNRF